MAILITFDILSHSNLGGMHTACFVQAQCGCKKTRAHTTVYIAAHNQIKCELLALNCRQCFQTSCFSL